MGYLTTLSKWYIVALVLVFICLHSWVCLLHTVLFIDLLMILAIMDIIYGAYYYWVVYRCLMYIGVSKAGVLHQQVDSYDLST